MEQNSDQSLQVIFNKIDKCDDYSRLSELRRGINSLSSGKFSSPLSEEEKASIESKMDLSSMDQVNNVGREFLKSGTKCEGEKELEYNDNFDLSLNIDENNVKKLQNSIKSEIKKMIQIKTANEMDPVQRAGETEEMNIKKAGKFGREDEAVKESGNDGEKHQSGKGLLGAILDLVEIATTQTFSVSQMLEKAVAESVKDAYSKNNDKGKQGYSR